MMIKKEKKGKKKKKKKPLDAVDFKVSSRLRRTDGVSSPGLPSGDCRSLGRALVNEDGHSCTCGSLWHCQILSSCLFVKIVFHAFILMLTTSFYLDFY